jgi:hypothetical protein
MQTMMELIDTQATDVLFSVSIVIIGYVIARLVTARGSLALAVAFAPLLLVWAFDNAATRQVLVNFL